MISQINEMLSFYINTFEQDMPEKDLLKFLKKEYGFNDETEFMNLLINNFILIQSEVMKDLKEINDRINNIDKRRAEIDRSSYEFRKLDYCRRINSEAKEDIERFLTEEAINYIKKRVVNKKKWTRTTGDLAVLVNSLPYKYSYFKRFYDPNYDFSTDAKYRFLLNHSPRKIQPKIDLKSNNKSEYYKDLENNLMDNDLLDKVMNSIRNHHVLKKREEIFETLFDLYKDEKYQSFVNLAVIQVEGLFYDFCFILNDENEIDSPGTLSVKAEKVFSSTPELWLSMYPYFAFEAPIFRNKIAHNGFWDLKGIKNFANELIFDLFAIVTAIKSSKKLPYNLLRIVLPLREEIKKVELSYENYPTVLHSLFGGMGTINGKEFFDILKRREEKRKVLEFYRIHISEFESTNLYEECCRLTQVIYDERFWDIVINFLSDIPERRKGQPFDFVSFAESLANNYIYEFPKDSPLKKKCILIKKDLERFSK
ncbi:hypothetical protein [Peribacillus sp. S4]|uniref:hypothetical protein n=1 Tax=Peribacillus sp. S4 TaxID=3384451 RepID=UPI003988A923